MSDIFLTGAGNGYATTSGEQGAAIFSTAYNQQTRDNIGATIDTEVSFNFVGWLGMTAGAYLLPPLSYNGPFHQIAKQQFDLIIERTFLAGAIWPITFGPSDTLATVEETLEAPKKLLDFLLERADNTTGTGSFDVYDDPDGVISLHQPYGYDLTLGDNPTTFS